MKLITRFKNELFFLNLKEFKSFKFLFIVIPLTSCFVSLNLIINIISRIVYENNGINILLNIIINSLLVILNSLNLILNIKRYQKYKTQYIKNTIIH